jgi:branched-chain amino acid transport system substrate-binding protein
VRTKTYLLTMLAVSTSLAGLVIACSDDAADTNPISTTDGGTDGNTAAETSTETPCAPATPVAGDCTTTKCTAAAGGEPSMCVANQCVKMKSLDCTEVFGELKDDTIFFGSVFPLAGANASSGKARRQAVQLAVEEINSKGGIPTTSDKCDKPRPLAFVSCTDTSGAPLADGGVASAAELTQRLKDVGNHLSKDLKLPFVIGAGTSGNTTTLAGILLPNKTMQIAPSATAVSITTLADATQDGTRLMWRTAPSDVNQGAAMVAMYPQLETLVKAGNNNTAAKVFILSKSDPYGSGIDAALKAGLTPNGKTVAAGIVDGNVVADCYNASGSTAACADTKTPAAALAAITAVKPDIIVLTGTAEAVTDIMIKYEQSGPAPKPLYLLPDGMRRAELATYIKDTAGADELRTRVRGTIPGVVTPLAQDFYNFRYKAKFPTDQLIFGMAGAYDATYLFGYAMASLGKNPATGISIAKAFEKTVGGTERVDVGPTSLAKGFTALLGGGKIDFNGASGPLDFDFTTGEALSDINVWCIGIDPNTSSPVFKDSTGQTYDATGKKLNGNYTCQ